MNTNHSPHTVRVQPWAALLACAALPLLAPAQTTVRDTPPPSSASRHGRGAAAELKRHDRDFFEKAAKASLAAVEISRVAAARTSNPEVRKFAEQMSADHAAVADELAALAATKGVSLPAKEMHPSRWEKRDAKNFDRDYISRMVSDHEDVVKRFEREAKSGDDADTVAFARKHLPQLQEHLQRAHDLKRRLK